MEYEALATAREMATEHERKVIARLKEIAERAKSDPTLQPPVGFQYIDTAPLNGSFVRLRFRPGLGREGVEETGRWFAEPDGFCGWRDRSGGLIAPGPLFWAPAHNHSH